MVPNKNWTVLLRVEYIVNGKPVENRTEFNGKSAENTTELTGNSAENTTELTVN